MAMDYRVPFRTCMIVLFSYLVEVLAQSSPSSSSGKPPLTPSAIVVGVLSILSGLLLLFFGRRIFKSVLFFAGMYIGILIAFVILVNVEPVNAQGVSQWPNRDAIYFGVCLGTGIILGILSSCFWRLGLFLVGAFGGFTLGMWILAWASSSLISNNTALIAGILALFLEHHVIIISTSIGGSFLIIYGVDCFTRLGFYTTVSIFLQGDTSLYKVNDDGIYALLGSMLALAIIGIIVQYRITGRGVSMISEQYAKR